MPVAMLFQMFIERVTRARGAIVGEENINTQPLESTLLMKTLPVVKITEVDPANVVVIIKALASIIDTSLKYVFKNHTNFELLENSFHVEPAAGCRCEELDCTAEMTTEITDCIE